MAPPGTAVHGMADTAGTRIHSGPAAKEEATMAQSIPMSPLELPVQGFFNDNDFPRQSEREPCLIAERSTVNKDTAGVFMFRDCLASLRDDLDYDCSHRINDDGAVLVHRVEAIGDLVWNA